MFFCASCTYIFQRLTKSKEPIRLCSPSVPKVAQEKSYDIDCWLIIHPKFSDVSRRFCLNDNGQSSKKSLYRS